MKAYNKAVLAVDEFILNADIAEASQPGGDPDQNVNTQGGSGNLSAGIEFEINVNGNDEI